jgi:TctA family transporter
MIRRLIFVLTCIYFDGSFAIFQVFISMLMTVALINYLTVFKPHKDPGDNNSEIFTEVCTLNFIYVLLVYTGFIDAPDLRFTMGYISIGIMFLNILVNLLRVVRITF